jgi:hypothetical protein
LHPERRVLFALNEPGYFRMYGPTITEMTRRGWTVGLAFEKPERRGPSPSLPPSAGAALELIGRPPTDVWSAAATLRLGIDYVRYLEPAFADATYLRHRVERYLPDSLRPLMRIRQLPGRVVSLLITASRMIERLIPARRAAVQFLAQFRPDVVLVTPLVTLGKPGVHQTEILKAARALRIPVIVGVGSWDHLTSKGLVRLVPDAVLVWNETQRREAVRLHRVPSSRVVITGAQPLDHWFEPVSIAAVQSFRRSLGIDDDRKILLVVGSSPKMAPGESEVLFVRRWLAAVRASQNPEVRRAFVIVRPHPGNTAPWLDVDLADPAAVIHPRTYPTFPLTEWEIDLFRCSLAAATAVVGINTTAMIEAAILRRPVLTVRDAAFDHSQRQTLHFAYLTREHGGFALSADSLAEHLTQLERILGGDVDLRASDHFVEQFVRPRGLERPSTLQVCDAIEAVAATRRRSTPDPIAHQAVSEPTR